MAYHHHTPAQRKKIKAKKRKKGNSKVARAMREVHENIPSTVKRAKHFGPGGREAMLRAIALNKARKGGAKIPRPPKSAYPKRHK